MAETASQDEQMPNPLKIEDFLIKKIKNEPSGIEASSQKEPPTKA